MSVIVPSVSDLHPTISLVIFQFFNTVNDNVHAVGVHLVNVMQSPHYIHCKLKGAGFYWQSVTHLELARLKRMHTDYYSFQMRATKMNPNVAY